MFFIMIGVWLVWFLIFFGLLFERFVMILFKIEMFVQDIYNVYSMDKIKLMVKLIVLCVVVDKELVVVKVSKLCSKVVLVK